MNKMLRMETMWDKVSSMEFVNLELLEKATDRLILRQNTNDPQIVQCAMYIPQNLMMKFTQLRIMLKGRCKALKLFYDVNPYLAGIFADLGFERIQDQIWRYTHPEYSVTATVNPTFTDSSLVMSVESKKGSGIPSTALQLATLFDYQLKLRESVKAVAIS
ncbi:hypothetical protein ACFPOG_12750 [Paenibacillus aestuarii]|uniref:DUF3907 family protein n=1 Tax=Paenibacillus aestuarii TaxID=516965 RepID=A0ABW0K7C2_9BACL